LGRLAGLPEPDIGFDITIHMATLLAVVLYYRRELLDLAVAFLRNRPGSGFAARPYRFLWFVVLTSLPTGIAGLFLQSRIENLHANLPVVAACFGVTTIWLFWTHRRQKQGGGSPLLDRAWLVPVLIGVAQGVAILPGVSRSGMTIGAAILLGVVDRDAAAYGFLVSIPAILGAFLLELPHIAGQAFTVAYGVGFAAAFLVGLAAIRAVVVFVDKARLHWFAWYVAAVAVFTLAVGVTG